MKISKKCQYALRAVLELSLRNTSQPVKIHIIADAQGISARFLEVILNQLRHAGIVESRRGNEGGYLLARPAEKITVGQVIESIQGPVSITENIENDKGVNEVYFGNYAFQRLWEKVNYQISNICYNTSFSDLVRNEMAKRTEFVPNYTI